MTNHTPNGENNKQTSTEQTSIQKNAGRVGRWMQPEALSMAAQAQQLSEAEQQDAGMLRAIPGWGVLDGQGRGDETLACAWAARERVLQGTHPGWMRLDLSLEEAAPAPEQGHPAQAHPAQRACALVGSALRWWLLELQQAGASVWCAPATEHYARQLTPALLSVPGREPALLIMVEDSLGDFFAAAQLNGQPVSSYRALDEELQVLSEWYHKAQERGEAPAIGSAAEHDIAMDDWTWFQLREISGHSGWSLRSTAVEHWLSGQALRTFTRPVSAQRNPSLSPADQLRAWDRERRG